MEGLVKLLLSPILYFIFLMFIGVGVSIIRWDTMYLSPIVMVFSFPAATWILVVRIIAGVIALGALFYDE